MRVETTDIVFGLTMASLIVLGLTLILFSYGPWPCESRWDGYETDWSFTGGCKVLTDSGYIPEDNFRVTTTP
jgi:hypothetical protein